MDVFTLVSAHKGCDARFFIRFENFENQPPLRIEPREKDRYMQMLAQLILIVHQCIHRS